MAAIQDIRPEGPTSYRELIQDVRENLREPQPRFWSDDALLKHLRAGTRDLWRAIIDLHAGHFSVIDNTSMYIPAANPTAGNPPIVGVSSITQSNDPNANYIIGVPPNLFRVLMIEPRDLQQSSETRGVTFQPRKYNTMEFQGARGLDAKDPGTYPLVFYDIVFQGPPINAPGIVFAPQLLTQLALNVWYIPTLPKLSFNSINPIPGESDLALVSWATAYALAKEPVTGTGVGTPDPGWMSVYATEKQHLMTALTPRQEQEPEIVEGIFDYY